MTQILDLQPVANQSITATLDNERYQITIKETGGVMSVTIVRNEQAIYTNLRAVSGFPLIPYRYQEQGNFVFETENDQLPDYKQFGITQFLVYASPTELMRFRNG